MNIDPGWSAGDAADAIRTGAITSRALVDSLLARIDTFNPRVNAIVTLDRRAARQRALDADAAAGRGEWWGPLHGVPVTIKDAFETAGLRTVSGHRRFLNHVPADDAAAVARLRNAGAIILGKTNLPPLASGIQSDNPVFGRTNNPWDLGRTPGGSSGGSAAAIAAMLSYLEFGSDIGGSIRIPAHFCGIFGLKATAGRIPGTGHLASVRQLRVPAGWEPLMRLPSFGPLARSVDDLRLALSIVADTSTPNLEPALPKPAGELRLAWTDDFGGAPFSGDSRRVFSSFIGTLTSAAGVVSRQTSAGFDFHDAWYAGGACLGAVNTLLQSAGAQLFRRFIVAPALSSFGAGDPLMRGLYAGASLRSGIVGAALEQREQIAGQLDDFLGRWDAWICPVFPTPAFTHRSTRARIDVDGRHVMMLRANLLHNLVFNLTGHPVVSIPIGLSAEGLPIGVQIVGGRWQDLRLLDVAEQIASVTGGFRRPPGY